MADLSVSSYLPRVARPCVWQLWLASLQSHDFSSSVQRPLLPNEEALAKQRGVPID